MRQGGPQRGSAEREHERRPATIDQRRAEPHLPRAVRSHISTLLHGHVDPRARAPSVHRHAVPPRFATTTPEAGPPRSPASLQSELRQLYLRSLSYLYRQGRITQAHLRQQQYQRFLASRQHQEALASQQLQYQLYQHGCVSIGGMMPGNDNRFADVVLNARSGVDARRAGLPGRKQLPPVSALTYSTLHVRRQRARSPSVVCGWAPIAAAQGVAAPPAGGVGVLSAPAHPQGATIQAERPHPVALRCSRRFSQPIAARTGADPRHRPGSGHPRCL